MPEIYDRRLGPAVFHPFAVEVARRAAALASRAVLELAAGTGIVTRELVAALPGAAVTATDLNLAMVAWGARAVPQARWAVADAQQLPFRDGRFDLVACQFGVMFLADKKAAFAQAHRVLAPGGRLLFTTWHTLDAHEFERALMVGVRAGLPRRPAPVPGAGPARLPRPRPGRRRRGGGRLQDGRGGDAHADRTRGSARDLAVGYCTGTPCAPASRAAATWPRRRRWSRRPSRRSSGTGPVAAEMTAHVVEARLV